ncbi:protein-disulfide isomerase [Paenibacillus pectinilyticus]|uniref:Protein-disulfide isomerase n=1 Tax=Paenibacillus pectinilyticus TaxID=512399 RepID=A0A1C1A699_9BACL|nr:DsbA family oxidoreductase [Paenibacillus pectinilyticus]OCT16083.1 protein-disulfide isomerase [Paenibacillus pectinilyticus]
MQVEIWSDFACPFCYIGKRRFEKALANFAHRDQVEVVYRSFELDRHAPLSVPHDVYDMLSSRYGMSRQEAIQMNENMRHQAAADGLDFQFGGLVLTNTFDAHRLRLFAETAGKGAAVSELLFRAYFTESKNISDHDTLADIAVETGLDREEVLSVLASDQFAEHVRAEEDEGTRLGIRGVPYYVINRKHAISGAQASGVYLNALQQIWEAQQPAPVADSASDEACLDGTCAVPSKP